MAVGWKVLTHDLRSPIRGGAPIWGGALPYALPTVPVDQGEEDCGEGWAFCPQLEDALRIAGLWPDGWPSRAFAVAASGTVVSGPQKSRSTGMLLVREAEASEIETAVRGLSDVFGAHAEWMATQQLAWRSALARPGASALGITNALQVALQERQLAWTVTQYASPAAMEWISAGSREARWRWETREAHKAGAALSVATQDVRDLWRARGPWKDAATGEACHDAQGALLQEYALREGWLPSDTPRLTVGLRDAYQAGLRYVAPAAPGVLGWVM